MAIESPSAWAEILDRLERASTDAWRERADLLERLAGLGPPKEDGLEDRAVKALEALATSPKWEIRRAAADVLPHLSHVKTQNMLDRLGGDPNKWVRESARWARKKLRINSSIDKRDRKYDQIRKLVLQLKRKHPDEITDEIADEVLKIAFKAGEKYYEELAAEAVHQTNTIRQSLEAAVESLTSELAQDGVIKSTAAKKRVRSSLDDIALEKDNLFEIFKVLMEYYHPWDAPMKRENLAVIVEAALGQARKHARDIDLQKIDVRCDLQSGIEIEANRIGMEQAIRNLIVNAMEAMPKGGALSVTVSSLSQSAASVVVLDTGVGMTPEQLDAYKRPGTSSKKDEKRWRTGFGLPFAIKIIELGHNGRLSWETAPGKGTTVRVDLPMRQGDVE